jgi:hypothetical protein
MNLSGLGLNKAFKSGIDPKKPYYYISGSLDLSGAVFGGTYFFNFDNDFKYASLRDYANYITIDENSVISEVLVYSDPDMEAEDLQSDVYLAIGGADQSAPVPNNSVKVWWAAPAGFGPYVYPSVSKVSSVARNGSNVATIVTSLPHGLVSGNKVNIIDLAAPNTGFNATNVIVTVLSSASFTYSNIGALVVPAVIASSAPGYVEFNPAQQSSIAASTVSTVARNGSNVATIVTTAPHNLLTGDRVTISGVPAPNASFNAVNVLITYVNATTFTYSNSGAVVVTVGASGTVTFLPAGGNPFFNGYPISLSELEAGPVNYFGHEGGHFPYYYNPVDEEEELSRKYKYLAVTVLDALPDNPVVPIPEPALADSEQVNQEEIVVFEESQESKESNESQGRNRALAAKNMKKRKSLIRGLPSGTKAISKGKLTVTIKVYPKNQ